MAETIAVSSAEEADLILGPEWKSDHLESFNSGPLIPVLADYREQIARDDSLDLEPLVGKKIYIEGGRRSAIALAAHLNGAADMRVVSIVLQSLFQE